MEYLSKSLFSFQTGFHSKTGFSVGMGANKDATVPAVSNLKNNVV